MYKAHFGLSELPFSLTPDTDYFFGLQPHTEALQVLMTALHQGEGFIKVTGEVGTGKTMICRKLLNVLPEEYQLAYLPNPSLPAHEIVQALACELNITNTEQSQLNQRLQQRLLELATEGKKVVLLLDEAQALSLKSLETIRLLGNLETEKQKLLQIVLFSQPELDRRLKRQELRQLNQRITFNYCLRPLNLREVGSYIEHRLAISGYRGAPLLSLKTFKVIHKYSGGIPRLINVICHKSLMLSYGKGERLITNKIIRLAINDTQAATGLTMKILKRLGISSLFFVGGFFLSIAPQYYLGA